MSRRIAPLLPYVRRHRVALVVGTLAIVVGDLAALLGPWFLKQAIDALKGQRLDLVLRATLLMVGTAVVGGYFRYLMRSRMIGASRTIEFELREDFARHALRLSPSYYATHKVGEMMALATNDLNAIRMLLGPGIMYLVDTAVTTVIALLLMIKLAPTLCLIAFAPLPLLGLCMQQINSRVHSRFTRVQELFAELSSFAQEALTGVRVIKSYAREEEMGRRFVQQSRDYMQRNIGLLQLQSVLHPLMTLLAGFAAVLTLYFGGRQVIVGTISVGTLVAFLSYLAMLTWPAIAAGWAISIWQRGLVSLERVDAVLTAIPEIQDDADALPWTRRSGRVVFDAVTFRYPGSDAAAVAGASF